MMQLGYSVGPPFLDRDGPDAAHQHQQHVFCFSPFKIHLLWLLLQVQPPDYLILIFFVVFASMAAANYTVRRWSSKNTVKSLENLLSQSYPTVLSSLSSCLPMFMYIYTYVHLYICTYRTACLYPPGPSHCRYSLIELNIIHSLRF